MFAIRAIEDGALLEGRFYTYEDAYFCLEDVAYDFEIDVEDLDVVEVAS